MHAFAPAPRVRLFAVTVVTLLLAPTTPAEPIPAPEAEKILSAAQAADAQYGSFRTVTVRQDKDRTTTTTQLTKRTKGAPRLSRTETVTEYASHPERTRRRLTLVNAEGNWQIIGNKALLMPNLVKNDQQLAAVGRALQTNPDGTATPPPTDPKTAALVAKAKTLAGHVHLEGERTTENGRAVVRITRTYDKEIRDFMQGIADEQFAEVKKHLSFGKRLLVSTVLAAQGGLGGVIPAREVFTVDVTANRVVLTETYNAAGKRLGRSSREKDPEPIADLPPETFAVPAGLEVLRPQTLGEAIELSTKLTDEERKNARKTASAVDADTD